MNPEQTVRLLQIRTTIGDIYIEGKPYHPSVEALELHRQEGQWVDAHLKCVSLAPEVKVQSVQVFSPLTGELVDWDRQTPVLPCFYEQQTYEWIYERRDDVTMPINFYHVNRQLREAVTWKGTRILSGLLNFRNEVGFSELELRSGGQRLLSVELEVFPSKLDYREDYVRLLQEVNRQIYNLSFDFLKRTYQSATLRDTEHQSLTEFFSIITHLFDHMERAMERITLQPHHRMERHTEVRKASQARRPSRKNSQYLSSHPQYLERLNVEYDQHRQRSERSSNDRFEQQYGADSNARLGRSYSSGARLDTRSTSSNSTSQRRGEHATRHAMSRPGTIPIAGEAYRPTRLLDTVKRLSYDTAENRFLRWMLERILVRLNQLQEQYEQLSRPTNYRSRSYDEQFSLVVAQMIRRLERMLSVEWLKKLTPMRSMSISLVMQMAPGYREMYRYYLTLLKGLSIQSDLLRLSMKEISELYEYWCFLKLNELLARKYSLVEQSVIKLNHSGLFVTLDRGQQSQMKYRHPRTGELFVLYYNSAPKGTASPTLAQRPDNVLSLHKQDAGKQKTYNFIFDAKYRIHVAEQGSAYRVMYKQPGPQEEDINTMHRYRDAMVHLDDSSAEDRERYERTMYGAYVLFPYGDEEQYREHHFYKSIQRINVGALPFLPNATSLVEQFLDELIADSPEKSYERATVPQRTEEYYEDAIEQRQRNMLIGSVRGREQVELALKHRFYHVPLRNLNDVQVVTQLNYVAMYQSKRSFGAQGQEGIRYYGRITGWQIMRRGDIEELPPDERKQDQLYVKLNVEDWQERTPAIMPEGQGIYTLLLTSKYMFDRADELAELRLETEEQLTQWREKRRQGRVKVTLDQHYADLAEKVLDITVEPESE
ncbi:DUF2357 domain-containing protein [Paenibacillus hunanensis]|uniref:DUF2357 domain-containing protein n=1 Tax=Paenibacillus hunanensis TaxID=539262 RepID=UPI002A699EA5|nr:DUF2357 domain-containing protein [Paenibacillus hunanensis]WPP40707.1 DUF2357 domain-containing protein [Paenibacillus hunanensis]